MRLAECNNIHIIGAGGSGVSALARFFRARGAQVSGSDQTSNSVTEDLIKNGSTIHRGHAEDHVPADIDAVIFSSAIAEENPERKIARQRRVPEYSYTEALGCLMRDSTGIAVSGTNGKTTTAALLGEVIVPHLDPTVIVGGYVPPWKGNFREGRKDMLIVEGCEYRRNMLNLDPKIIVLTNIEADHLDYYKDLDDVRDAFDTYVSRLPEDGLLVFNHDDENCRAAAKRTRARTVSFGFDKGATCRAHNIQRRDGLQEFEVYYKEASMGAFRTSLPGRFNIYNALAAILTAHELGVPAEDMRRQVEVFTGAERRFERFCKIDGTPVVLDYAHHPTAVRGAIEAARSLYPDGRILTIFQPHQRDRTIKLFDQFVDALYGAEDVVVAEIYAVEGRNEADKKISARDIVNALRDRGHTNATYAANTKEVKEIIKARANTNNCGAVLVMGAGDIDAAVRVVVQ